MQHSTPREASSTKGDTTRGRGGENENESLLCTLAARKNKYRDPTVQQFRLQLRPTLARLNKCLRALPIPAAEASGDEIGDPARLKKRVRLGLRIKSGDELPHLAEADADHGGFRVGTHAWEVVVR